MNLADLQFAARNAFTWSLPAFKRIINLEAVRPQLSEAGRVRVRDLEQQFDFSRWATCCNLQDWRESLYVLDLVSRVLPTALTAGRVLDVGAKNGCTMPGLATAFGGGVDAVELDAHRRYAWGSTRRVYGERMASAFEHCRFIAGDVRALIGPYTVVTWFLPFVSMAPLEAWGLPARFLAPAELLRHVISTIAPGGVMLVVNQGEEEAALQRQLFSTVGARPEELGRVESALSPFRKERFGFVLSV